MSPNPIWKRNSTPESQKMLLTQEQAYPSSKDVKLLNMPKFFGYIKSYNSSCKNRNLLKVLTVRASVVDQEELKICWKLEKRPYFSR